MDGQETMMNQLLTFVILDRVLDGGGDLGGREVRDLVLPLMLCSNVATAGQAQPAGSVGPATTGGSDMSNPLQMILLLSLLRHRQHERHE
jgi:hypothetical protein